MQAGAVKVTQGINFKLVTMFHPTLVILNHVALVVLLTPEVWLSTKHSFLMLALILKIPLTFVLSGDMIPLVSKLTSKNKLTVITIQLVHKVMQREFSSRV